MPRKTAMKKMLYRISIRCYYKENYITHKQLMKLSDIDTWIQSYKFTHPDVKEFSIRIFIDEGISEKVYAENKPPDST